MSIIVKCRSLNFPNRLLQAAARLPETFTAEDLVVAAWESWPLFFGLAGYGYPDNHRCLSVLCGKRGLVRTGFLERVAVNRYRLTVVGHARAAALSANGNGCVGWHRVAGGKWRPVVSAATPLEAGKLLVACEMENGDECCCLPAGRQPGEE